ncbi:hypothetical protein HII31_05568 [Pseudocercospora fuligena]|uniref:Uncharacterized protein n=1 Tax=Pseudocercospora fuligena TaxID=685502 RepID=A0A8H6RKH5_9PEZI|nr:hypothetical protein HII31_05568 [Pseudocercospora fuligena]
MSSAKRKPPAGKDNSPAKRARIQVPEYHLTPSVQEEDGSIRWPAPSAQIARAREIILESSQSQGNVVIVPDKDADGLSAGAILRRTLVLLGLPKEIIHVHLLTKGNTVHSEEERTEMSALKPAYVFVIDHGSRSGPPLVSNTHKGLVIDHHFATQSDFPDGSEHVSACHSPPVATSSLLTYEICKPLHVRVEETCDWLCVVGTHGDLGNTLKWAPPFPDMSATMKRFTKKTLNDVVSLVNAPRRTASYDVISAWDALCETEEPATVLKNARLLAARRDVNEEVERCTHTAPKFSGDNKVAVFRINSKAQVHPVIATRWAGHLQSKSLEMIMVANEGYLEGKVNFSCRIPRCARNNDPPVDIIQRLKAYASLSDEHDDEGVEQVKMEDADQRPNLLQRMGDDFARGHVQASGGIVAVDEFEELMKKMKVGVKVPRAQDSSPKKKKEIDAGQKNNLLTYFNKKST